MGEVAVISGAAAGSGAGTGRRRAEAGAHVALGVYSPDGHDVGVVRTGIEALGRKAIIVEVDVGAADSVDALVDRTLGDFGRLDIAVANAAIARRRPSIELDDEEWGNTLNIDLTGVWRLFRACLVPSKGAGSGAVAAARPPASP